MRIREGSRNDLYYLLTDHLGSTALTVGETGVVLGEMRYTAWGEARYAWGSTPTNNRYTGQRQDADIGLYYYRARWYDPALGRFAQADTIGGGDRYRYVNNNPMKFTDPSGHDAWWCTTQSCRWQYIKNTSDARPFMWNMSLDDKIGMFGVTLTEEEGAGWTDRQKLSVYTALRDVGWRAAEESGTFGTADTAFRRGFGTDVEGLEIRKVVSYKDYDGGADPFTRSLGDRSIVKQIDIWHLLDVLLARKPLRDFSTDYPSA